MSEQCRRFGALLEGKGSNKNQKKERKGQKTRATALK
jgi:hypothetical protein